MSEDTRNVQGLSPVMPQFVEVGVMRRILERRLRGPARKVGQKPEKCEFTEPREGNNSRKRRAVGCVELLWGVQKDWPWKQTIAFVFVRV